MEINPYVGIRGTYASHFRNNPERKLKKTEEKIYLYNVKHVSKIYSPTNKREHTQNNFILTNKQKQAVKAYNPPFKEISNEFIDILI